ARDAPGSFSESQYHVINLSIRDLNSDCDFNSDSLCTHPTPIDRLFLDFLISVDLSHCHVYPTRGNRCIDWIIGNDPSLIKTISIVPPFPSCDHSGLSFSLSSPQSPSLPSQIRDFTRVDYSAFSNYLLSIDWFSLFCDCPDIDSIYSAFSSAIHSAIDLFVPYRTPRPPSLSYPPHIRRLIKHRDALFSKVHLPSVRILFDQCSKKLLFEIDKWTRYSTRKKLSRVNDLYRHISSLTKPKLSIPELVSPQNLPNLPLTLLLMMVVSLPFPPHVFPPSLSLFTFFPHEVYKSLRKLSPTGSTGHDAIPQIIFSKCAYALSTPLADIFSLSLISGTVPSAWKHSLITPIPKPGKDSKLPSSYRPISIISPAAKTMERLIKEHLNSHLSRFNVLPSNQHGFRSGASVVTNLLTCQNDWTSAHSKKLVTDVVYIDFTRAFDVVPYPKLLARLSYYERRVIGDLCMTHMIMNGFTIIPRSLFYVYKPLRDRTSSFGINIELTTSTPRYHSFPVRTSRWYSQLPDSIRTAPNIRVFKRRLENHPIIAHLAKLT
ncbi:hypothetical protein PRIPAC_71330, partial [Pristionchus pacificus]|uniref:Reverse transcriptase domain-containing protein n=1 Tax=Pristionchus pacificus TaxID=54126 RepID=A0A2A6C8J8_PRIPA